MHSFDRPPFSVGGSANRNWLDLAPRSRPRWIAAYGGPRSDPADVRAGRARRAYESGAHLTPAQRGHEPAASVTWSAVVTTTGIRPVTTTTRVETTRVAQHAYDTRRLLEGEMNSGEFGRKWRRRVRRADGVELESDPVRVIAAFAESGPPPEPFYRSRQRRAA